MTRGAPDLGRERAGRSSGSVLTAGRTQSPGLDLQGPEGRRAVPQGSRRGRSARAGVRGRVGLSVGGPPPEAGGAEAVTSGPSPPTGRCPAALGTRLGRSLQMGSTRDPGRAPRWGALQTKGRPGHKPALARGAACSRRPRTSPRAGGRRTVSGGQRPRYVLSTEGGDRRLWGDAPLSSKRNTRRL